MTRKTNVRRLPHIAETFEQPELVTPVKTDYFVERDGVKFAGRHLLLDFWGAKNLGDATLIERSLRQGAIAAGATTLHVHLKKFGEDGGVSGVIVLAESHISIHTWPERNFAAIDIFMCGSCDPHHAMPVLEAAFAPSRTGVSAHKRGEHSL